MTKQAEAALAVKLAAGTQKHLSTVAQMTIGSTSYTPVQVESELQSLANLRAAVDTAKAAVQAALADYASQGPAMHAFFVAFIAYVQAVYGNSPDILADFGLTPKKARKPLTAGEQAAAIAKRNATRAARGTKGSQQKAAIHGNVTGVTVTPVTTVTPPAAVQTASSASSAPSAAK
jgi:hypothetical protein